jgi:thiopurine S-methyltransferase
MASGTNGDGIPTPEYLKYWKKTKPKWHKKEVNPVLIKHIGLLTSGAGNPSPSKKILVPLCGKTVDLFYLMGLGHQVFGIEGVQKFVLALQRQHDVKFKHRPEESIYEIENGNGGTLRIYCGDLFGIPDVDDFFRKWGPFDAVWDRSSLIAVEYDQRRAYVEILKKSLRDSNGKCKQEVFNSIFTV